jgi:pimeloyl-ACP methyl ester carboxylesterase
MRTTVLTMLLVSAALLAGCGQDEAIYTTDARKANGLVVILPGIEGESEMNRGIREGLMNGGVDYALVIRSWGVPVPGVGMIVNQTNFLGNRVAGAGVARMIAEYQTANPGKPVFVVGHSGGGGVAVFAAEALADMEGDHRVDGLVLLDASISAGYDLSKALGRSRKGLANFYNVNDGALLGFGTAFLGNVDGGHGASAGLQGFQGEFPHLFQISVDSPDSGDDPHAAATKPYYVASNVAPWIRAQAWPPGAGKRVAGAK